MSAPRVAETITELRVPATTLTDVVRWSGAIDDYTAIHFDAEAAAARGLPGPVVNGPWKAALLVRMLENWAGERATVARLSCRYRRPDLVGAGLTCGGTVTGVTPADTHDVVDCDVWVADEHGATTVTGSATVHMRRAAGSTADPADPGPVTLAGEDLKAALRIGEEAGRFTYEVPAGDIRRFREAVGDPAPDSTGPLLAPPTFFAALDPVERRDLQIEAVLDDIPYAKTGGGNAFNEVEYERPIRAGDVITVVTTYTEAYERDGRAGRLLFRVRANELYDAAGALVGRTRMGHVLAFDLDRMAR
jgi:acyl dehydratase